MERYQASLPMQVSRKMTPGQDPNVQAAKIQRLHRCYTSSSTMKVGIRGGMWRGYDKLRGGEGVPEGCHHKAVVQCQGQRAGPEQARGDLQATNISE